MPELTTLNNSEAGPVLACPVDAGGHCITCSDEALPATVLRLDLDTETALVLVGGQESEVDVSLLEGVAAGDTLLVHGGVALFNQTRQGGGGN